MNTTVMEKAEVKSLNAGEVRDFPLGRLEFVKVADRQVARATLLPGWRWSLNVKPIAKTDSCCISHFQYVVSGVLHVKMDDGSEFDCRSGDVVNVPPGHDAWVVGNEPAVLVDFQGMVDYAKGE